jgi:hypothetical protein
MAKTTDHPMQEYVAVPPQWHDDEATPAEWLEVHSPTPRRCHPRGTSSVRLT